jgi:hypothetical protein
MPSQEMAVPNNQLTFRHSESDESICQSRTRELVCERSRSDLSITCIDQLDQRLPSRTVLNWWVAWVDTQERLFWWDASRWSILNLIEPKSLLIWNVRFQGEQMGSILKLTRPTTAKNPIVFTCRWPRRPTDANVVDKTLPGWILGTRNICCYACPINKECRSWERW